MTSDFLWWRDGVIYQIYPRSFADSNGDGIGDLQGIISRLDYLADLGVDGIWLSPINPSPDVDFGYDVSDYRDIDPKYGTMQDFLQLLREAHERNIHIILDLVLNHSSDQHPWFLESRSSIESEKRDWYLWKAGRDGENHPPNNWQAVFGGRAWEYDENTGEFYYHMFCKEQPDLNWRNPQVKSEMMDIFRFWSDLGVDGFRLDVFNEYFKDAQFRSNPSEFGIRPFDRQKHLYDTNQPEMFAVVREIRSLLDGYNERYVVGETFMSTQETAAAYCAPGMLHAAFDFSLLHSPFNAASMLKNYVTWENELDENAWPNNVLNNHDTPRSATRYHAPDNDEKLKVAAAMLLTLRGTPYLYYGEEIGMRDVHVKRSELQDPVGKRYWPLPVGRDGCRSPMQWTAETGAGFSSSKPWIKLHPNHMVRNVSTQHANPDSLLNFYKALMKMRKENLALRRGSFRTLTVEPKDVWVYLREGEGQTLLVALNFAARERTVHLPGLSDRNWELLLSSNVARGLGFSGGELKLAGFEAAILRMKL